MMSQYGWGTEGKTVVTDLPDQVNGRIFLTTGPSQGGLGAETAISLAHGSPSMIILLGRSLAKIQPTIDAIHALNPAITTKFFTIDLGSLKSVRATAKSILDDASIPHVDIMINNAAIMANPYTTTEDGYESQFATNHLAHFLLTNLLVPKILAAGPKSRIVNVSSWGHAFSDIHWDDVGFQGGKTYTPWDGYGQSKTANILTAVELNERLKSKGIRAFALHPGSIDTNLQVYVAAEPEQFKVALEQWTAMGKKLPSRERKTLQAGCSTTLTAALSPVLDRQDGVYLHDCQITTKPDDVSGYALDKENAKKLWTLSEEMSRRFQRGGTDQYADTADQNTDGVTNVHVDDDSKEVKPTDQSLAQPASLNNLPFEILENVFQYAMMEDLSKSYYFCCVYDEYLREVDIRGEFDDEFDMDGAICIALTNTKFYHVIKTIYPDPLRSIRTQELLLEWMAPKCRAFIYKSMVYKTADCRHGPFAVSVEAYGEPGSIREQKLFEKLTDSYNIKWDSLTIDLPDFAGKDDDDWYSEMLAIFEAPPTIWHTLEDKDTNRTWYSSFLMKYFQDIWLEEWGKMVKW